MSHRRDVAMALRIRDAAARQEAIMERKAIGKMNRPPPMAPTATSAAKTLNCQTETKVLV